METKLEEQEDEAEMFTEDKVDALHARKKSTNMVQGNHHELQSSGSENSQRVETLIVSERNELHNNQTAESHDKDAGKDNRCDTFHSIGYENSPKNSDSKIKVLPQINVISDHDNSKINKDSLLLEENQIIQSV